MDTENRVGMEPVLIIGIVVFVAAVCAYYFYDAKGPVSHVGTQDPVAAVAPAVAPASPLYLSSSSSASSVMVAACSANDVEGSIMWMGQESNLHGVARIRTREGVECQLGGAPEVMLISKSAEMPLSILVPGTDAAAIDMHSGDAVYLRMVWSNWCGGSVSDLQAKIVLPNDNGSLLIPFVGQNGIQQSFTPVCTDKTKASVLQLDSFSTN